MDYVSNPALAALKQAEQSEHQGILDGNVPEIKAGRQTIFMRRDKEDSEPEDDTNQIKVLNDYGANHA